jgi:hypothetical protein
MGQSFMAIDARLKQRILKLLKSDEEFRLAVASILGLDTILSELKSLEKTFLIFIKYQERRWEENNKRWKEASKRFEAIESELKRLKENFNRFYESTMRKMYSFEKRATSFRC